MRRLALPVRLAHMVAEAARHGSAEAASALAVLVTERGLGGDGPDLERRLARFAADRSPRATAARQLAARIARQAGGRLGAEAPAGVGRLLLSAWPDRVAKARGGRGRFLLANGRGAEIEETDALAGAAFLVVADLQGKAQSARIAAAAAVDEADIRAVLGRHIERRRTTAFDAARGSVRVRETERLGAIVLAERLLPPPRGAEADRAILEAVREEGLGVLPWGKEIDGAPAPPRLAASGAGRAMAGNDRRSPGDPPRRVAGAVPSWRSFAGEAHRPSARRRAAVAGAAGAATADRSAGADAFRGAVGKPRCRSATKARRRCSRSASRSCSGSTHIRRSPRARCR